MNVIYLIITVKLVKRESDINMIMLQYVKYKTHISRTQAIKERAIFTEIRIQVL